MDIRKSFIHVISLVSILASVVILIYYFNNDYRYIKVAPSLIVPKQTNSTEIPICNSQDRPRQQVILSTLEAWAQFASTNKIQYWMAYGSLVGYVQRGGLLPHDADTDILILANDTQYLVPFSKKNFSLTYEMKVHPQWYYVGYAKRSYYHSKGINFVAPNARFVHRKLRYHVDIWGIYDFHPDKPRNASNRGKTLTEYDQSYAWISSPIEWTFPLKECLFSGIKVWCPAMPERLVANIYGKKSINKSNKICVNGAWKSISL